MFGSELDLCREVAILTLYRQAIPIWSVGGSETIVNMIFERFRTSDEGEAICGEFHGGRTAWPKFSATSQSVSHSAALKSATYGLALVTRITAGSETLENHVYDGF